MLASRYLDQIVAALEYSHQHAVLHLNLTTDCIFIKQEGTLLVADFGVIHMLTIGAQYNTSTIRKGVYGMNEASSPCTRADSRSGH